ncbi:hypothetical protein B7P43_G04157 [Cryptotermes secundus]|uniref:PX domain-containing protein n=1 Tax=Cryptotermes secundus TaxID=105785 RepID=A0A2J7QXT2_9NEOP|nr:hypothetical protein B7P43_G04157 [Cryptotermes secundus]
MVPPKSDNWIRRFAVSDPRTHKKGFTVYKVTSIVFPRGSPEAVTKVVVWKRYNDFKKLYQELRTKHQKLYLQDKFPVFAKAKFFGRFEDDVIEERRKCAISLLEFIGDHPPLFTSNIFVKFFESGYTVDDGDSDKSPLTPTVPGGSIILEPDVIHPEPPCVKNINISAEGGDGNMRPKFGLETEGPMLKLGGTWQFPQQADSISLSSHSSDEGTNFTDTDSASALSGSGISSPLQSADLQFFDPLQQTPTKQPLLNSKQENEKKVLHTEVSNSWLLSLSPGPEKSQSDIHNDGATPQHKLSPTTVSQENGISLGKATSSNSQEQGPYSWQVPEPKSISSLQHDVYVDPHPTETESFSRLCAGRNQGFEAGQMQAVMPGNVTQEPASYIVEAANHVGQAQLHQAQGDYDAAFAFYKTGIACLLGGVQGDPDNKRKQVVREKTAQYLLQAEKIYSQHLASKSAELSLWDPKSSMQLQRPLSELQYYKVLGVINTVMLVLNTLDDRCYIMKVLHKSPCPVSDLKCPIVPQDVPYMVKLHGYFETESAVFLLLQHASGGKLWDHVDSYFQSLPPTPVHELSMGNVYLGKKLIQDGVSEAKTKCEGLAERGTTPVDYPEGIPVFDDADSVSSQDHSYVELLRDYASTATRKLFQCGKELYNNSQNSASNQESSIQNSKLGDKVPNKYDYNIQGVGKKLENNALSSKFQEEDDNVSQLSDTFQTYPQEHVNNAISNPVPDLLPQESRFLLSWKNLESLDTTDLVENAQKLLASVNKTLLNSETVVSRMKNDKVNNMAEEQVVAVGTDRCKSNTDSVLNAFVTGSGASVVTLTGENAAAKLSGTNKSSDTKSVMRCKSEDVPSAASTRRKERKLSAGRRRSVTAHSRTSLERRYSSDDIFEGHGRGLSGSLDRTQQISRLHSMIGHPKLRLPEANVRMWAAELVVVLDALHQWGIICRYC